MAHSPLKTCISHSTKPALLPSPNSNSSSSRHHTQQSSSQLRCKPSSRKQCLRVDCPSHHLALPPQPDSTVARANLASRQAPSPSARLHRPAVVCASLSVESSSIKGPLLRRLVPRTKEYSHCASFETSSMISTRRRQNSTRNARKVGYRVRQWNSSCIHVLTFCFVVKVSHVNL